jgi:hypothetical protein
MLDAFAYFSVKYSQTHILAVGPNAQLQNIKAEDIIVHSIDKYWMSRNQSSSSLIDLHKRIYNNSDSKAVLLCHPFYANVLHSKHLQPDFSIFQGAAEIIGGFTTASRDDFHDQI